MEMLRPNRTAMCGQHSMRDSSDAIDSPRPFLVCEEALSMTNKSKVRLEASSNSEETRVTWGCSFSVLTMIWDRKNTLTAAVDG